MGLYYVNINPQKNGDHEVHKNECEYLPNFINRKYLGVFTSCKSAVIAAKRTYPQSNGCKTCSDECHTQ
jgi:hypothetical protein